MVEQVRWEASDARGNLLRENTFQRHRREPRGLYRDQLSTTSRTTVCRQTTGRNAETFVYDGLGRVVASIDVNGGRTEIAFNDAGTQTIIVQANGYTKVASYNRAGYFWSLLMTAATFMWRSPPKPIATMPRAACG